MMKIVGILIVLLFLSACAEFRGYARLSVDEKNHYASVADQMTTDQKVRFLAFETREQRDEYLTLLNMGPNGPMASMAAVMPDAKPSQEAPRAIAPAAVITVEPVKPMNPAPLAIELEKPLAPQPAKKPVAVIKPTETKPLAKAEPPSKQEISQISPAPMAPAAKPSVVITAPKSAPSVPRVEYEKTGDPVTDVITLLKMLEAGKITKEQFENEKELAFR